MIMKFTILKRKLVEFKERIKLPRSYKLHRKGGRIAGIFVMVGTLVLSVFLVRQVSNYRSKAMETKNSTFSQRVYSNIAPTAAPLNRAISPETKEGTIYASVFDDFEKNESKINYELVTTSGEKIKIDYTGDKFIPSKSQVRVNATKMSSSAYAVDESTGVESITVLKTGTNANEAVGNKKTAILLLNYADYSGIPASDRPTTMSRPTNAEMTSFFNTTMHNYYNEVSYGKLNMTGDVFGWYTYGTAACGGVSIWQQGVDLLYQIGVDLNLYDNVLILAPWLNCGSGESNFGPKPYTAHNGNQTADFNLAVSWVKVDGWEESDHVTSFAFRIAHEMGHTFGLRHANGLECGHVSISPNMQDCTSLVYLDDYDPMGKEYTIKHYSAFRKLSLNWLTEDDILTVVPTGGDYTITPLETPGGIKALRIIRGDSSYYYIENRQPLGFDGYMPSVLFNSAYIYLAPLEMSAGNSQVIDMTPGSLTGKDGEDDFNDAVLTVGSVLHDTVNKIDISLVSKTLDGEMVIRVTPDVNTPKPVLVFPPDNFTYYSMDPLPFQWLPSSGAEPIGYQVVKSLAPDTSQIFEWLTEFECDETVPYDECFNPSLLHTTWYFGSPNNQVFYWRVNAKDNNGVITSSDWRRVTLLTTKPTTVPTTKPTTIPTTNPTTVPTTKPTTVPTTKPTTIPTTRPTTVPTGIQSQTGIFIGSTEVGSYSIPSGGFKRLSYTGVNSGPVKILSGNIDKIISSQRILYGGSSYSEMMGLPNEQLSKEYLFPYYNNVAMDSQLRVSNVGTSSTTITVTLAGQQIDSYTLAAGASTRKNYSGKNSGPLKVTSSASNILATVRVLYNTNSYSELMGLPAGQLTKEYLFPYYNNVAMDSQLRVSNVGTSSTTITVTLAGQQIDSYTLAAGASTRKNYSGKNSGPLKVTSSASNILATVRVLYNTNSYSELMGYPTNKLDKEYVYPVYDNVALDSQLRVSNVGTSSTTITVFLGTQQIDSYTLAAGGSTRKNYSGKNSGPLRVVSSNTNILSTVRMLYATNNYYEMTGLPKSQLSTQYFYPYYNNVAMSSELRIAKP
jgi:hypothetical protein